MPHRPVLRLREAGQQYVLDNPRVPHFLSLEWTPRNRSLKKGRADFDVVCLLLNEENTLSKPSDFTYWNNRKSAERTREGLHVIEVFEKRSPEKYTKKHWQCMRFCPDALPQDVHLVFAVALDRGACGVLSFTDVKDFAVTLSCDPSADGDPQSEAPEWLGLGLEKLAEVDVETSNLKDVKLLHVAELVHANGRWVLSTVCAAMDTPLQDFVARYTAHQ